MTPLRNSAEMSGERSLGAGLERATGVVPKAHRVPEVDRGATEAGISSPNS